MITVYTKPACVQCNATKRALDAKGLAYQTIKLTDERGTVLNQDALDLVKTMGYSQVPVVVVDNDHWGGFRPDKISALSSESMASKVPSLAR